MKKIKIKFNKLQKWAISKKNAYLKLILRERRLFKKDFKQSFNFGDIRPEHARIMALLFLIVFAGYVVMYKQYYAQSLMAKNDLMKNSFDQRTPQQIKKEIFKKELTTLVKGHPIEVMVPYIGEKDRETAAYIIAIAKKESNWGKRKPILNGADCYNYWGFRGKRERMGSGGHTCFDSPREAVEVISKRIDQIIERNSAESAKDMVVWKCGSNCAVTGGQASANKWIADVDIYAKKVLN